MARRLVWYHNILHATPDTDRGCGHGVCCQRYGDSRAAAAERLRCVKLMDRPRQRQQVLVPGHSWRSDLLAFGDAGRWTLRLEEA